MVLTKQFLEERCIEHPYGSFEDLEQLIDSTLWKEYRPEDVPIKVFHFYNLSRRIQNQLRKTYEEAGWKVEFTCVRAQSVDRRIIHGFIVLS